MPDPTLSASQLTVITALSNGGTTTAAAEQAGVHRNTIAGWRRNQLAFQQALAQARYDRALYFREKLEDLTGLAIQALQHILTDPKTSPSVRLKAALAVIAAAITPPPAHNVHNPAQSEIAAPPEVRPAAPAPKSAPPLPQLHNLAQSKPKVLAKPGRNQPCHCGSGKKYKRCCIDKPRVRTEFLQRLMSAA